MNIFDEIVPKNFKNGISLFNLTNDFFALYTSNIFNFSDKSILIVTSSLHEAKKLYSSISKYCNCLLYECDEIFLQSIDASSPELLSERLDVLNNLILNEKRIVITNLIGYIKKLPLVDSYKNSIIKLNCGDEISFEYLIFKFIDNGYQREELVVKTGDFAVRGYIIDLFLVNNEYPIRIEFFGDEIESIRYFDPDSQKSIKKIDNIIIFPFSESLNVGDCNITDYMGNHICIFKDYDQLHISYNRLICENSFLQKKCIDFNSIKEDYKIFYNDFDSFKTNNNIDFNVFPVPIFENNFNSLNNYIYNTLKSNKTIIICLNSNNIKKLEKYFNFEFILTTPDNIFANKVNVINYYLGEGFINNNYIFLSEYEILNKNKVVKRKNIKFKYSKRITDISKINIGDYIVHELCGIGIYNGIKSVKKNGIMGDYIEILYAKGDKLYIPVSKIDYISKFSSKEGYVPKINSLNSNAWEKTKQRVGEKIKYEAEKLLRVQAERKLKKGFSFDKDNELQALFESQFVYDETDDQLRATMEIKHDMEQDYPMDRLLCGDVGYGKTEVAFRAMFKAVMSNKQVMYLCPTTLLSRQQYLSAISRFSDFPIRIEILNRYNTAKETHKIIDDFKNGKIDILFGTHRILSDDVVPCDLGLLVIDEEQRFGVIHKEKIKEYKSNIDILTLTATPIPRTLQMSIFGLKDLSLIETPPKDRHAVQTYVIPFDKKIVRDIIYREISRDGQVFVLYNKVEDIQTKALELSKLVPDARVVFAHGKMDRNSLEDTMNDFVNGKYNVLFCTTIIETGVDIPNANTLIVYDSDRYGLSQLYQIRGRVGRSDRIAYAYLMYNKSKVLTETAVKRLQVLKNFTELGSGFSIAARDLSIRGSGDILGSEQAGFIDAVGIDLYMKLLKQEILKLKGIKIEKKEDSNYNNSINVDNHIKDEYVEDENIKIQIHKMINSINSFEKYDTVFDDLTDRFGKIDDDLKLYMNEQLFENITKKLGINKIFDNNNNIEVVFGSVKSNSIDYENLISESLKISNRYIFSYKNNCLYIKIIKTKSECHPIYLFNELFKKMC